MKKRLLLIFIVFTVLSHDALQAKGFKKKLSLQVDFVKAGQMVSIEKTEGSEYTYWYHILGGNNEMHFQFMSKVSTLYSSEINNLRAKGDIQLDGLYFVIADGIKVEEGQYAHNQKIGEWQYRTNNGIVNKKKYYETGEPESILVQYYSSAGELQRESQYLQTRAPQSRSDKNINEPTIVQHGLDKYYFPGGKLHSELNYVNGMIDGSVKTYFPNGQLHQDAVYKKDTLLSSKLWSISGKLSDEQSNKDDFFYSDLNIGLLKSMLHGVPGAETLSGKVTLIVNEFGVVDTVFANQANSKLNSLYRQLLPFKSWYAASGVPFAVSFVCEDVLDSISIMSDISWVYTERKGWLRHLNIKEEIPSNVEQMPQYPGGEIALMQYLSFSIKYPTVAQENGIQGRSFVQFVVRKDGSLTDLTIVRSAHPLLDQEAVRVISCMPKWVPGKDKGEVVNVQFMLPINFVLN